MKRSMGFIGDINEAISVETVEKLYKKKAKGITQDYTTFLSNATGSEVLFMELYFFGYVENYIRGSKCQLSGENFLFEWFHNISNVNAFVSSRFDRKNAIGGIYDAPKKLYSIKNSINCMEPVVNTTLGSGHNEEYLEASTWNSRLANLYILFRDIGIDFKFHCKSCEKISNLLESSFSNQLLRILKAFKKFDMVECFFNELFAQVAGLYWNFEALSMLFKSNVLQVLMCCSLSYGTYSYNSLDYTVGFLLFRWLSQSNLNFYIKRPFEGLVYRLLGNIFVNSGLSELEGSVLIENSDIMPFHSFFISVLLKSMINLLRQHIGTEMVSFESYSCYYHDGFKNIHVSNIIWHTLFRFSEEYIVSISRHLSQSSEDTSHRNLLQLISTSFLDDSHLYTWLSNLDFKNPKEDCDVFHCRIGVMLLYIIALHHQKPFMRITDINYLRLLHSLPWISGVLFCASDAVFNHMLSYVLKAVVQCFGEDILLNAALFITQSYFAHNIAFGMSGLAMCRMDWRYLGPTPVSRMSVDILSSACYMIAQRKSNTITQIFMGFEKEVHMSPSEFLYISICNILPRVLKSYPCTKSGEDHVKNYVEADISVFYDRCEWKWCLQFITSMYRGESTICLLAILDFLIYRYIMDNEDYSTKDKDVMDPDIFCRSNIASILHKSSDVDLVSVHEIQKVISSNYIALHQNPMNILLRIKQDAIVQLFRFRFFGNLLTQLLNKMNRYLYYGSSNFLANTRIRVDVMHLNVLQEAAAMNIILELISSVRSQEILIQIRSMLLIISSKNAITTELISSCGLPFNKCVRFVQRTFRSEMSISSVVERYRSSLQLLVTENQNMHEWCKSSVHINKVGRVFARSLEPYDLADIALFHLYLILILGTDSGVGSSKINCGTTDCEISGSIRAVVALFWDCVQCKVKGPPISLFIKNAIPLILKLHYLFPSIINDSNNILDALIHCGDDFVEIQTSLMRARGTLKIVLEELTRNKCLIRR